MNQIVFDYSAAYNILKESEIGKEKTTSMDDMFFQFTKDNCDIEQAMMQEYLSEKDNSFMMKINMPNLLKNVYRILGSSKREFNYKGYTFFSLDGIKKACELYEKDGQYKFCDIGVRYYGLGHVKVITLCRETRKLFIRMDGGGNGYERDINYKYFIKLDKVEEKVFTMDEFIKNTDALGENFVYLGEN